MRCRKVTHQLSAFLDGELTPKEAERIQEHLDACPTCRAEREALERTIHSVKGLPLVPAPADLRDGVLAGLERETKGEAVRPAPARFLRWRVLWPAAAAALIAVGIALLSPSVRGLKSRRAKSFARLDQDKPTAVQRGRGVYEEQEHAAEELFRDSVGRPESRLRREPEEGATIRALDDVQDAPGRMKERESLTADGLAGRLEAQPSTSAEKALKRDGPVAGEEVKRIAEGPSPEDKYEGFAFSRRVGGLAHSEQIVIRSAEPRVAFARAATLTNGYGWLSAEDLKRANEENARGDRPVGTISLLLTDDEVARLNGGLVHAGLLPTTLALGKSLGALVAGDFSDKANIVVSAAVQPKAQVVYMAESLRWDERGLAAGKEEILDPKVLSKETTDDERRRLHYANAIPEKRASESEVEAKPKAEPTVEGGLRFATAHKLAKQAVQKPLRQVVLVFVATPAKAGEAAEISAGITETPAAQPAEK